jgi:hypothetical protein
MESNLFSSGILRANLASYYVQSRGVNNNTSQQEQSPTPASPLKPILNVEEQHKPLSFLPRETPPKDNLFSRMAPQNLATKKTGYSTTPDVLTKKVHY